MNCETSIMKGEICDADDVKCGSERVVHTAEYGGMYTLALH